MRFRVGASEEMDLGRLDFDETCVLLQLVAFRGHG